MTVKVQKFSTVPDELERLLKAHIPSSLPLLRRLQFAKYQGGSTAESKIILVSGSDVSNQAQRFTAAYLDYSGGPDTQMWLYSTLEDHNGKDAANPEYREQLQELAQEVIRIGAEYGKGTVYPGGLLLGSLNTHVRKILEGLKRVRGRATGYYDKWLFKAEGLSGTDSELPEGMRWDTATLADCEIVVARTDIPRTPYVRSSLGRRILTS